MLFDLIGSAPGGNQLQRRLVITARKEFDPSLLRRKKFQLKKTFFMLLLEPVKQISAEIKGQFEISVPGKQFD